MVCAYLIWLHLITVARAAAASSFHFMMLPLGPAFGWLALGEHATPTDFIGVIPVALGVYLVTSRRSRASARRRWRRRSDSTLGDAVL